MIALTLEIFCACAFIKRVTRGQITHSSVRRQLSHGTNYRDQARRRAQSADMRSLSNLLRCKENIRSDHVIFPSSERNISVEIDYNSGWSAEIRTPKPYNYTTFLLQMKSFKECLKRNQVFCRRKRSASFFHLEDKVSINNGQMKRWLQQLVQ